MLLLASPLVCCQGGAVCAPTMGRCSLVPFCGEGQGLSGKTASAPWMAAEQPLEVTPFQGVRVGGTPAAPGSPF